MYSLKISEHLNNSKYGIKNEPTLQPLGYNFLPAAKGLIYFENFVQLLLYNIDLLSRSWKAIIIDSSVGETGLGAVSGIISPAGSGGLSSGRFESSAVRTFSEIACFF